MLCHSLVCTAYFIQRQYLHSLLITLNHRNTTITSLEMPRKKKIFIYCCRQWYLGGGNPSSFRGSVCVFGGGYWAGMCNWNAHRSLRTRTDVEAQRKAHRHKRTDMHVLLCPADQATRTSAQWRRVLYFQKWCMIGTIKHKEKKCYCASTHNYLMLFANRCLLYFDISLLFSIFQMFVNI